MLFDVCDEPTVTGVFLCSLQLTLLAEVRALIAPQDLERFDGQVVHHEMEAWRVRHGGLGLLHHNKTICSSHPEGLVSNACLMSASAMGYAKVCVSYYSYLCEYLPLT